MQLYGMQLVLWHPSSHVACCCFSIATIGIPSTFENGVPQNKKLNFFRLSSSRNQSPRL
jgi:hypothetical protein